MRRLAPALALALSLALAGCAFLRSEGEESLVVRNRDVQPVSAVITVEQEEGGFQMFREGVAVGPGGERAFVLALRPGAHTVSLSASSGLVDSVEIEIPESGDTTIEVEFRRGSAAITTTSA